MTPLTVSGAASGFALAIAARIRAEGRLRSNAARAAAAVARLAPGAIVGVGVGAAADGRPGTSTGVPMMASIGVASATLPPYSLIDSAIAPITRWVPASSGQ